MTLCLHANFAVVRTARPPQDLAIRSGNLKLALRFSRPRDVDAIEPRWENTATRGEPDESKTVHSCSCSCSPDCCGSCLCSSRHRRLRYGQRALLQGYGNGLSLH